MRWSAISRSYFKEQVAILSLFRQSFDSTISIHLLNSATSIEIQFTMIHQNGKDILFTIISETKVTLNNYW